MGLHGSQSSSCMTVLCCCCSLQKERVSVGDVIYIEANSGAVKRVGRCDAYATEFDLEAEEYVPLPKVPTLYSKAPASLHRHCRSAPSIPAGGEIWDTLRACKQLPYHWAGLPRT